VPAPAPEIVEVSLDILDGAAHFYANYVCADGKFISVGAIEPQFYKVLCNKLNVSDEIQTSQYTREKWPVYKAKFTGIFAAQPQSHWTELFAGTDACVAPIEDMHSAAQHPHLRARSSFATPGGVLQPAPAPRFSQTPSRIGGAPPDIDADRDEVLADWGL